jgi:hypothetical protein
MDGEIGGVCSVDGKDAKCIQGFGPKTWRDETTCKTYV